MLATLHVGWGESWLVIWDRSADGRWVASKPIVSSSPRGAWAFLPAVAWRVDCPPTFAAEAYWL